MSFTGVVATFTDADPNGIVSDYTASIDWGDGTTTAGVLGGGPTFTVTGTHIYVGTTPSYPITVTIHDTGGASAVANSTANVDLSTIPVLDPRALAALAVVLAGAAVPVMRKV
jgi:hypothetical protein